MRALLNQRSEPSELCSVGFSSPLQMTNIQKELYSLTGVEGQRPYREVWNRTGSSKGIVKGAGTLNVPSVKGEFLVSRRNGFPPARE